MNYVNWKYIALIGGLFAMPGCSGFGNPPPEPMGMAVEEMAQTQTYAPYANENPGELRLDGAKGQKVIDVYRGNAESGTGIQGDIEINIGD